MKKVIVSQLDEEEEEEEEGEEDAKAVEEDASAPEIPVASTGNNDREVDK